MPEGIDDEAFQDFLDESRELLADLEPAILALEDNPEDPDLVDEPFRILHSIKGMASFFNLAPIKNVSHRLEDLLGEIRDEDIAVDEPIIDALFRGSEILHELYEDVFDGNLDVELDEEERTFLDGLDELAETAPKPEERLRELLNDLEDPLESLLDDPETAERDEVQELMDVVSRARTALSSPGTEESEEESEALPDQLFDPPHDYHGVAVGEDLRSLETIARDVVDNEIEEADSERIETFTDTLDHLIETSQEQEWTDVIDPLGEMREEIKQFRETAGFGYVLCRSLIQHLESIKDVMELSVEDTDSADPGTDSGDAGSDVKKTFRVEEEKVDDFMEYVGELIVTGEMYRHLQQELSTEDVDTELRNQFKNTNQAFKDLSDDLQESLMEIRKIKMDTLLKKFPVMVRKLSRQLDKEIDVETSGEDILVDKSLIEQLETPMTHLVRNAVDHGIEPPDVREENDKPAEGHLTIDVEEDRDELSIVIEDDGAGLDGDDIREKCVDEGIMSEREAEETDYDEIIQYIFHSGFSTADEVTDVSGRGVGMDSVKQSINAVDGEVELSSEPGEGTTVSISLPKAQAVIVVNGLVVEVGEHQFIIPLEQVIESVSINKAEVSEVEGKGEMLNLRGTLHPLFRLEDTLDLGSVPSEERSVVMVVESETETFAIGVDQIREQQKVVVKDMGPVFQGVDFVRGSAVMGDGRICLVLDIEGLGHQARRRRTSQTVARH
jgi:two-component system chemotaxis sensor kinase CheA